MEPQPFLSHIGGPRWKSFSLTEPVLQMVGIAKLVQQTTAQGSQSPQGGRDQAGKLTLSCIHGKETSKACLKIQDKVQVLVSVLHKAEVKKRRKSDSASWSGKGKRKTSAVAGPSTFLFSLQSQLAVNSRYFKNVSFVQSGSTYCYPTWIHDLHPKKPSLAVYPRSQLK